MTKLDWVEAGIASILAKSLIFLTPLLWVSGLTGIVWIALIFLLFCSISFCIDYIIVVTFFKGNTALERKLHEKLKVIKK